MGWREGGTDRGQWACLGVDGKDLRDIVLADGITDEDDGGPVGLQVQVTGGTFWKKPIYMGQRGIWGDLAGDSWRNKG